MKPVALFSAPLLAVLVMLFAVVVVLAPAQTAPVLASSGCWSAAGGPGSGMHLDPQQWDVARAIVAAGQQHGVAARGWVIAIAAGIQESGLRPLPYGDRDSLGVFQQRSSWGPDSARMDPTSSAQMFFLGGMNGQPGLLSVTGWAQLPLTQAAQAVQVSAYPDAYAKWEGLASQVVGQLTGQAGGCLPAGSLVSPIGPNPLLLTSAFGQCDGPQVPCNPGVDFSVPTGSPITAASDGLVVFAAAASSGEYLVEVLHADGVATFYGGLSQVRTSLGAQVHAGDLIGLAGTTNPSGPGMAGVPGLHFEVHTQASPTSAGVPVDPLQWLHSHGVP